MKIIYLLPFAFLASCEFVANNGSTNDADTLALEQPVLPPQHPNISGCYMQVLQRDTFMAKLQVNGQRVQGNLVFDNHEKDGSRGTVNGTISGDTIKLEYVFTSEGMNSVMDVYFKVENDALVRGIGDMDVKGDTAYFTNPAAVTFPQSTVLKKVNCSEIE